MNAKELNILSIIFWVKSTVGYMTLFLVIKQWTEIQTKTSHLEFAHAQHRPLSFSQIVIIIQVHHTTKIDPQLVW